MHAPYAFHTTIKRRSKLENENKIQWQAIEAASILHRQSPRMIESIFIRYLLKALRFINCPPVHSFRVRFARKEWKIASSLYLTGRECTDITSDGEYRSRWRQDKTFKRAVAGTTLYFLNSFQKWYICIWWKKLEVESSHVDSTKNWYLLSCRCDGTYVFSS